MGHEVNSPESFGIFPGDPEYDEFSVIYPNSGARAIDWQDDALGFGLDHPVNPREEAARQVTQARFKVNNVGRNAAERYVSGETGTLPEHDLDYLQAQAELCEAEDRLSSFNN